MGAIETIGGGVASGALGLMTGALSNAMGQNNVRDNNAMEIASNKEMTDYNMGKQLELWEKTGYGAQMKQMDKAGLNPALMYKNGGAGGSTAIQASNITAKGNSVQAPHVSMEVGQQIANMMAQEELTRKQTEVAEAQKIKLQAETPGINAETENKGYKNIVDKQTTENQIGKIKNEDATGFEKLKQETSNTAFQSETYKTRKETLEQELNNKIFDNVLMHSNNTKIQAEIPNIKETLITIIKDRINQSRNTNIKEKEMNMLETEQQIKRTLERLKLSQEDTKMYLEMIKGLGQAGVIAGAKPDIIYK